MQKCIINFGMGLPIADLRDQEFKTRLIDDGIEALRAANISGLTIGIRFDVSAALAVELASPSVRAPVIRVLQTLNPRAALSRPQRGDLAHGAGEAPERPEEQSA